VKRIPRAVTSTSGDSSSLESGTCIDPSELQHASQRQLIRLDEFPLPAICFESPDPLKVDLNRARRKMAASPQPYNRAFAIITQRHTFTHEHSDVKSVE
jgi:hypothetical protein